jgi:hypothetical protein
VAIGDGDHVHDCTMAYLFEPVKKNQTTT